MGLAVNALGDLFIVDTGNSRIRKIPSGVSINVRSLDTVTTLAASADTSTYGQTVTLTATVASGTPSNAVPTGVVEFLNFNMVSGMGRLSTGRLH